MRLTEQRRTELDRMDLPTDEQTLTRMNSFMLRSGLTRSEFAQATGFAYSSLQLYMTGHYGKHHDSKRDNTRSIRAALKEFMDLHDAVAFDTAPKVHYATQSYEEVRRAVFSALRKGVAYVMDGPPGTEKTHSLRKVQQDVQDAGAGRFVYVYARINHSPQSFLVECCTAAGIPNRGTIDQLLRKLQFFMATGRTVLAIDEAQHLNHAGLEVLRQLLDLPPYFGVVLAGSHDLTQRLSHWQMEQWRRRVRKTIYLNGPTQAEARRILRAELGDGLTDAICDDTIAKCMSNASRVRTQRGKQVSEAFEYISASDLFHAIEHAKETLANRNAAQQKGAA